MSQDRLQLELDGAKDLIGVAREWACKILASRTPVGWQQDHLPEDIAAAAERQAHAIADLLPDAVRVWAHRSGRDVAAVTAAERRDMAAAIAVTIREAAAAQVVVDAATCGAVNRRAW
jgi:hypothetical protein